MFRIEYLFIIRRQVLYMQHMVFTVHLCWLAANTIRMEEFLSDSASQRRCTVNTICCIYSTCLLMINRYSIRNMQRIDYSNKLRNKGASGWSLLNNCITMHGPENVKHWRSTFRLQINTVFSLRYNFIRFYSQFFPPNPLLKIKRLNSISCKSR